MAREGAEVVPRRAGDARVQAPGPGGPVPGVPVRVFQYSPAQAVRADLHGEVVAERGPPRVLEREVRGGRGAQVDTALRDAVLGAEWGIGIARPVHGRCIPRARGRVA